MCPRVNVLDTTPRAGYCFVDALDTAFWTQHVGLCLPVMILLELSVYVFVPDASFMSMCCNFSCSDGASRDMCCIVNAPDTAFSTTYRIVHVHDAASRAVCRIAHVPDAASGTRCRIGCLPDITSWAMCPGVHVLDATSRVKIVLIP